MPVNCLILVLEFSSTGCHDCWRKSIFIVPVRSNTAIRLQNMRIGSMMSDEEIIRNPQPIMEHGLTFFHGDVGPARCLASMKAGDPKCDGLAEPISCIATFVSYCFIRFGFGQVHWNFTIIDIFTSLKSFVERGCMGRSPFPPSLLPILRSRTKAVVPLDPSNNPCVGTLKLWICGLHGYGTNHGRITKNL